MLCPSCGKDNPDGMRFCVHCGARLATTVEQPVGQCLRGEVLRLLWGRI
jgi:predicted amidophosphoribosyltransferase